MKQFPPLEQVIEYIEKHLNEPIGLSDVSRETGYSYYHMTRLFSSVLGESVGRYINRRRLYNASEQLIHSNRRVIDIALDCGTHRSAFASLLKTYQFIFGTWLPTAKEQFDNRDDFEVYEREVKSFDDPDNEVKIFIPVK